jgi:hypothetical protein
MLLLPQPAHVQQCRDECLAEKLLKLSLVAALSCTVAAE